MEKRTFLAVFLSLIVVFVFQAIVGPQSNPTTKQTQHIDVNELAQEDKTADAEPKAEVSPVISDDPVVIEEVTKVISGPFAIEFTNKGGNIKDIQLPEFKYSFPIKNYVNIKTFENKPFEHLELAQNTHVFSYQDDNWKINKKYIFENNYNININLNIKNLSLMPTGYDGIIEFLMVDLSRLDNAFNKSDWTLFEYSIKSNNKINRKGNANNFNDKWNKEFDGAVQWMSFRDRYFATIVESDSETQQYYVNSLNNNELSLSGKLSETIIDPGEEKTFSFIIYAGPQKLDTLKMAKPGFERLMAFSDWGWLDAIAKFIYKLLGFIHRIIPVWGVCIILISLIVYGCMYPLTLKSLVSMKKMQALQPKMAELREKHKKNPEKLNQEIMELYRRNQVNPLSGCLPMLLQMPIFVGLYQVLWRSFYFRGEGFLWIKDLSMPDRLIKLPFTIPFLGEYINILPICMTVIMFVQQRMNMKNTVTADPDQQMQQKMMAIFFPIFLGFIFYNFASGLNLYFVVFYLLSTVSQWHIARKTEAVA